jgi:uncharacterized protein (DUF1684 family)
VIPRRLIVHGRCRKIMVPSLEDYAKSLELMRKEKDYFFQSDPSSPIPAGIRSRFLGLAYFPPDPAFRIQVRLTKMTHTESVVLATSKGVPRPMVRYGYFDFEIDGMEQRLYAYKSTPQPGHRHTHESLFVPFRDGTSGKESYGAARYLDLDEGPAEEVVLDFNMAYNPYCAYSDEYVCPFPPRENWLTVPIRAGEMNFPSH